MTLKTYPFDAARYIDEQGELEILADAISSGSPAHLFVALDVVARSRGMTQIAREAGISRAELFEAARAEDEVDVDKLTKVFRSLTNSNSGLTASAAE